MFEKGNANWLSELPSVIEKYNNTIRSSTKMTPHEASKKVNEKVVYNNLKDKREIQNPKSKLGQLVRTSDIKKYSRKVIEQTIAISFIQSQRSFMTLYHHIELTI